MNEAYIDESGTHDPKVMVLGGLIASQGQWTKFCKAWRNCFGSDEAARAFKAARCVDRSLMVRLATVTSEHAMCAFVVSIREDEYLAHTTPRFRSQRGSAYTMCVKEITAQIAKFAHEHSVSGSIAYYLDAGHRNQNQANDFLRRMYEDPKARNGLKMSAFAFGDDVLFWGLKASDLLANGFYQELMGRRPEHFSEFLNKLQVVRHDITSQDISRLVGDLKTLYASGVHRKSVL